jgi:TatD DNase family protein
VIEAAGPSPIIDTHTHLDDPAFDADRESVIEASRIAGVRYFINIGYAPDRWESSRELREKHPDIDIALGVHPQLASQFDAALASELKRAIGVLAPIAVGETGFDFSRSAPSFDAQERAFRGQLEMAATERLPVIVHQRDASDALIRELEKWSGLASIVLHSFDGTQRLADWARDRGCYIGIGGLATRRSSKSLRGLLARIPLNRLLLETDSPYLAPRSSESRRNSPANLPKIADGLGPLWNLSGEELCQLTSRNAAGLFRLSAGNWSAQITRHGQHREVPTSSSELESGQDPRDPRAPSV